jgi:hypothetical protein
MEWIKCNDRMPQPTAYGGKILCIVHAFETNVSGQRMPYNSYTGSMMMMKTNGTITPKENYSLDLRETSLSQIANSS